MVRFITRRAPTRTHHVYDYRVLIERTAQYETFTREVLCCWRGRSGRFSGAIGGGYCAFENGFNVSYYWRQRRERANRGINRNGLTDRGKEERGREEGTQEGGGVTAKKSRLNEGSTSSGSESGEGAGADQESQGSNDGEGGK